MLRPGHFYFVEDSFVDLYDIADTAEIFRHLVGVVLRDSALCQDHHINSANEDGNIFYCITPNQKEMNEQLR